MVLGRETDFTGEALYTCTQALRYAAADHPDSARIQAAARRAQLITIAYIQRNIIELRNTDNSILRDRIEECSRCDHHNPEKGCRKCEKYGCAKAKIGYIKKYLGEEAYQIMCDYYEELKKHCNRE